MIELAIRLVVTFVLVIARMLSPRPVFQRPPGVYDAQ